jgi:hypothetical protein
VRPRHPDAVALARVGRDLGHAFANDLIAATLQRRDTRARRHRAGRQRVLGAGRRRHGQHAFAGGVPHLHNLRARAANLAEVRARRGAGVVVGMLEQLPQARMARNPVQLVQPLLRGLHEQPGELVGGCLGTDPGGLDEVGLHLAIADRDDGRDHQSR